jgi:hypothetical protein
MKMISLLKEDVSKYTNAGISKFAVAIASLTATNPAAVQKFAITHNLNIEKLYQFLKKSKLDAKMDFVTALVGNPGNPIQKKMIKMFQESVNEERNSNLFYVLYQKKDGKFSKPQAAGYASREDAEKFAKSLNNHSTMILDKNDFSGVKGVKVTNESVNEAKVFVHNEKTGEKYEVLSGKGKGDLIIAMKALEKAAPSHMKYSIKEGTLMEMNRQLNVKVNKMLERELGDLRKGGPNHQFAIMYILQGALTDANFHSVSRKVPSLFPKAKYEGDPMAEKDLIQMYEYDLGPNIAALAKWDGKDIVDAIGFYVSMTIGRPMGEKIEKLVEGKK